MVQIYPNIAVSTTNQGEPALGTARILFVDARGLSTDSSIQDNTLYQNIDESQYSLYGNDSLLIDAIKETRAINKSNPIDVIVTPGTGGSSAVATITITGAATADGELTFSAVKKRAGTAVNNKGNIQGIKVAVTSGDTAADIATNLFNAIESVRTEEDLFTITDDTSGVLTLTSIPKSSACNSFYLSLTGAETDKSAPEGSVIIAGVAVATTHWTGGSGGSFLLDSQDLEAAINTEQGLSFVVWVCNDIDINVAKAFWESKRNISYGNNQAAIVFFAESDTLTNLSNTATSIKSEIICMTGLSQPAVVGGSNNAYGTPVHIIAAQKAAIMALREVDGADLSIYITNLSADAQRGGIKTLALPTFNTIIPNLPLANNSLEFTIAEKENLIDAGVSVFQTSLDKTQVAYSKSPMTAYEPGFELTLNRERIEQVLAELLLQTFKVSPYAQAAVTTENAPANNTNFVTIPQIKNAVVQWHSNNQDIGLIDNSSATSELFSSTLKVELEAAGAVKISFETVPPQALESITITQTFKLGGNE